MFNYRHLPFTKYEQVQRLFPVCLCVVLRAIVMCYFEFMDCFLYYVHCLHCTVIQLSGYVYSRKCANKLTVIVSLSLSLSQRQLSQPQWRCYFSFIQQKISVQSSGGSYLFATSSTDEYSQILHCPFTSMNCIVIVLKQSHSTTLLICTADMIKNNDKYY